MDLNGLKGFLGKDWDNVRHLIEDSLKSDIDMLDSTNRMILSNSGKQLRPLISILVARACGGGKTTESSYRYAAAAELLHNATLLHDDVADNSCQRRGLPTVMSLMGPSVSVLLGDYWLVKAMGLVIGPEKESHRVIRIFSKTLSDLAEGEMFQLQKAQSGDTTEEDYLRIIFSKTASLFEASAVSAAISVGASPEIEKAVRDYAVALGIAFQIRDDIFDYSVSENIGKPVGVDIMEQKITMPLLGVLAGNGREEEIREKIREIGSHPEYRDELIGYVRENGGIGYAQRRLEDFVSQAVDSLGALPDSEEKAALAELALYVGQRTI